MKLSLVIFLCILAPLCLVAKPSKDTSLIIFSIKNGDSERYGLKDAKGKIILQAIYSQILWRDNGDWAYVEDRKAGKIAVGMIDRKGKFVITPTTEYCDILPNGDGLLVASNCDEKSYKVIINKEGKLISPQKFHSVSKFENGIAVVSIKDKNSNQIYGHIDTAGKYITLFSEKYEDAEQFSEGLATVSKNGKWGYVNTKGTLVITIKYSFATAFNNGKAEVTLIDGASTGIYEIDKNGKLLKKLRDY